MDNMEEFIRESRIVMLSFYIDNEQLKSRATTLIEKKTRIITSQMGTRLVSEHVARNQALDAYYEMGSRYFKRYASKNWRIFLKDQAKVRFDNMVAELAVIDEVIFQIQSRIKRKTDIALISELGRYLMIKVRLEKAVDMIESAMLHMIESHLFREKLLADVVRYFYRSYQATQQERQQQRPKPPTSRPKKKPPLFPSRFPR